MITKYLQERSKLKRSGQYHDFKMGLFEKNSNFKVRLYEHLSGQNIPYKVRKIKCIARIPEYRFINIPHWNGQTSEEIHWLKLSLLADIGVPRTGKIAPRFKKNYTIVEDHDFATGILTFSWTKPDA